MLVLTYRSICPTQWGEPYSVYIGLPGDADYLDKVTALANNFRSQQQITNGTIGAIPIPSPAKTSVTLRSMSILLHCAEQGIVFTDADMKEIANTFMTNIYLDDATFSDWVGGGSTNNPSYIPQLGRWVRLSSWRTGIYTTVRNLFDESNFGSAQPWLDMDC